MLLYQRSTDNLFWMALTFDIVPKSLHIRLLCHVHFMLRGTCTYIVIVLFTSDSVYEGPGRVVDLHVQWRHHSMSKWVWLARLFPLTACG